VFAAQVVWFACALRWHPRFAFVARAIWFACVFAGIRVLLSCFKRRPAQGRRLNGKHRSADARAKAKTPTGNA
jgi:hypothetical protein